MEDNSPSVHFISRYDFSLQHSSVDDAVHLLMLLGPRAMMAKADLISAFHMIPVHFQDWELLGMRWQGAFYHETCLSFGLCSTPFPSTLMCCSGFSPTITVSPVSSTISMIPFWLDLQIPHGAPSTLTNFHMKIPGSSCGDGQG